ncbi:hypothetical protein J6590_035195 [Homalodisca vitripennis]|nr:hypothetical protein J6590_035195 [Homalodisca vitripennis]
MPLRRPGPYEYTSIPGRKFLQFGGREFVVSYKYGGVATTPIMQVKQTCPLCSRIKECTRYKRSPPLSPLTRLR